MSILDGDYSLIYDALIFIGIFSLNIALFAAGIRNGFKAIEAIRKEQDRSHYEKLAVRFFDGWGIVSAYILAISFVCATSVAESYDSIFEHGHFKDFFFMILFLALGIIFFNYCVHYLFRGLYDIHKEVSWSSNIKRTIMYFALSIGSAVFMSIYLGLLVHRNVNIVYFTFFLK